MSASGWAPLCVVLGLLASAADSSGGRPGRVLTDEDLETFRRDGVLVVPQLLAPEEVAAARRGLHATLARYGIDHEQWNGSARRLRPLQLTGGKGGIVDVYYDEWAMALRTHPRVFAAMDELWAATWAADGGGAEGFTAPQTPDFVISNSSEARGYAYLDRAVWRLPLPGAGAQGSTQPHLLPHFDQCPLDLFGDRGLVEPPTRWRPIQSSISLSDVPAEPNSGGFVAALGFHREFASYFQKWSNITRDGRDGVHCSGQFSVLRDGVRLGAGEDAAVLARLQPIATPAGSAVFWDWRIPHSSTAGHVGEVPREAVYAGFLPPTALNERYAKDQWDAYQARQLPPDFSGGRVLPSHVLAPIMPPAPEGSGLDVLGRMPDSQLARQLLGAGAERGGGHDDL